MVSNYFKYYAIPHCLPALYMWQAMNTNMICLGKIAERQIKFATKMAKGYK